MITTITTTTTTTVVILQQAGIIASFGVVVLIASLFTKELLGPSEGKTRWSSLANRLKMAISPLLFAFAIIVAVRIWEVI